VPVLAVKEKNPSIFWNWQADGRFHDLTPPLDSAFQFYRNISDNRKLFQQFNFVKNLANKNLQYHGDAGE
jgi:hypothetical protein